MRVIYQPKGKAKEYCELAINLYRGCSHGCLYCYAPSATFRTYEDFTTNIVPRKDIINSIRREIKRYKNKDIMLCFTCDPYQEIDDTYKLTNQAINIIKDNGCNVVILTKAGIRSTRDFYLLSPSDKYGTTLTFSNNDDSIKWEKNAALPFGRIEALRMAKKQNISTWVSIEPVIDPKQSLEMIKLSSPYVDMFKVGKWNYSKEANKINWRRFINDAIELLDKLNKKYYIKKDLIIWR